MAWGVVDSCYQPAHGLTTTNDDVCGYPFWIEAGWIRMQKQKWLGTYYCSRRNGWTRFRGFEAQMHGLVHRRIVGYLIFLWQIKHSFVQPALEKAKRYGCFFKTVH